MFSTEISPMAKSLTFIHSKDLWMGKVYVEVFTVKVVDQLKAV